jgi:hypothetical protein
MKKEIFKSIKGTKGMYQIGNKGTVKNKSGDILKGHIWSPDGSTQRGRLLVIMGYVHILVAEHFLTKKRGDKFVTHIDGDYLNNDYKNLKWSTHMTFSKAVAELRAEKWKKNYTGKNNWNSRAFKIDNKKFNTLKEAALFLGKSNPGAMDVIKKRLINKNFKNYNYI